MPNDVKQVRYCGECAGVVGATTGDFCVCDVPQVPESGEPPSPAIEALIDDLINATVSRVFETAEDNSHYLGDINKVREFARNNMRVGPKPEFEAVLRAFRDISAAPERAELEGLLHTFFYNALRLGRARIGSAEEHLYAENAQADKAAILALFDRLAAGKAAAELTKEQQQAIAGTYLTTGPLIGYTKYLMRIAGRTTDSVVAENRAAREALQKAFNLDLENCLKGKVG